MAINISLNKSVAHPVGLHPTSIMALYTTPLDVTVEATGRRMCLLPEVRSCLDVVCMLLFPVKQPVCMGNTGIVGNRAIANSSVQGT